MMLLPAVLFKINPHYETSMALVTFCFGSIFGIVTVRMPCFTIDIMLSWHRLLHRQQPQMCLYLAFLISFDRMEGRKRSISETATNEIISFLQIF